MKYFFFAMQDFQSDGGGSIRMYGILNELADQGKDVIFISNATNFANFDSRIKHISIQHSISGNKKAKLQALAGVLPARIVVKFYSKLFEDIECALENANALHSKVYFFEYLDNTIGYLLKKKGLISKYINDLHGIATTEFKYQYLNANNILNKIEFYIKYKVADSLDRKVFEFGDGFIYASKSMEKYYANLYKIKGKDSFIIPYVLGKEIANRKPDEKLKGKLLSKLKISNADFVFFFAGTYKATAGVQDLIMAYSKFLKDNKKSKLILIGTGRTRSECENLINELQINEEVILIHKIPYEQLATYQSLANVIICPDRQNPYSSLIVHLKYFDSLVSDKLVINGAFDSVQEVNENDFLSLTFKPSDVKSLYNALRKSYFEYESLCKKYEGTKAYTLDNLTYRSQLNQLITKH